MRTELVKVTSSFRNNNVLYIYQKAHATTDTHTYIDTGSLAMITNGYWCTASIAKRMPKNNICMHGCLLRAHTCEMVYGMCVCVCACTINGIIAFYLKDAKHCEHDQLSWMNNWPFRSSDFFALNTLHLIQLFVHLFHVPHPTRSPRFSWYVGCRPPPSDSFVHFCHEIALISNAFSQSKVKFDCVDENKKINDKNGQCIIKVYMVTRISLVNGKCASAN